MEHTGLRAGHSAAQGELSQSRGGRGGGARLDRIRNRLVGSLRGVGRMIARSAVVLLVVVIMTLLHFRSSVQDALGPLGPRLARAGMLEQLVLAQQPPDAGSNRRVLVMNEQRMEFNVDVSTDSIEEVLTHASQTCPTGQGMGAPVITPDRGYVICLRPEITHVLNSDSPINLRTLFGGLDYLYAERHGSRTLTIGLHSSDDFDITAFAPEEGDTPGVELADFPRPPESARIFQSYEQEEPYRLTVFSRNSRSPDELIRWYHDHVDTEIWYSPDLDAIARQQHEEVGPGRGAMFWRRDDRSRYTVVSFDARPQTESGTPAGTTIAIAEAL